MSESQRDSYRSASLFLVYESGFNPPPRAEAFMRRVETVLPTLAIATQQFLSR